MQSNEINVQDFVQERKSDIKVLEKAINSSRKKTMLFQRLPFYRRRRTRSNFVKKKKGTRQKHRHFLKTHIWYAKRFKMIKINNIGLPLTRNQKSSSFIYKSQNRGFIFDESFKNTLVFNIDESHSWDLPINRDIINRIQLVKSNEGYIEIILTKLYCIVISPVPFNLGSTPLYRLECCISLIKMDIESSLPESSPLVSFNNIESFNNIDSSFNNIDSYLEPSLDAPFFVKNDNDYESGKIFLKSKCVMQIWNDLCLKGCIPVSIDELQRLALENDYMVYPFDDVTSQFYKMIEDTQNKEFIEKYERTPKSKKTQIDFTDLVIQTSSLVTYYIFELEKGVLKKNAFIFNNGNEVIGRIIRGSFCYTTGKSRGLCYTYKEIDFNLTYQSKNHDHANVYSLKFIKKIN